MAAYGALVSLMNTMQQVQNHPRISIYFDKKQIEYLLEKIGFLQEFMERRSHRSSEEAEALEGQIASAAYEAEDAVESHVADLILAESRENSSITLLDLQKVMDDIDSIKEKFKEAVESHVPDQIISGSRGNSSVSLPDLQRVIDDTDSIQENVKEVKDEIHVTEDAVESHVSDQILPESNEKILKATTKRRLRILHPRSAPAISSRPVTTRKTTMVGFHDYWFQLRSSLTGHQSDLQVIPITGMGGIGKTTLARFAFQDKLISDSFPIRAWATVSQNYSLREILLELLPKQDGKTESFLALDQHQLKETLHKHLWGRRYVIVLDDIWDFEAWESLKPFLQDHRKGSCIIVTTRSRDVASRLNPAYLEIGFLSKSESWELLCQTTFGQKRCPTELIDVGEKIAKNCQGLPLSIVVIGGFLRNSDKSKEFWEIVAKGTNSILNSEGEEQCLGILSLSYSHLSVHLKPCFLYMGIFPEDEEIYVFRLIKLWVAEGFLKPSEPQSLEEVAERYLNDLVDRNLILVRKWGSDGRIKSCSIHDLLRKLCLRIAQKEKFLCVIKSVDTPSAINRERRIVIDENTFFPNFFHALEGASLRSLICKGYPRFKFRLLRVLSAFDDGVGDCGFLETDFVNVNLRCLDLRFGSYTKFQGGEAASACRSFFLPRIVSQCWNLHTICIKGSKARITAPSEIWQMPRLKHLLVHILLVPDPLPSERVDLVLENLQTLGIVENFRISEEVVKRIPNIKKLKMLYDDLPPECEAISCYCAHNLGRFHKLESLYLYFGTQQRWHHSMLYITFPQSLRKLSLFGGSSICWEDMNKIGSLPHLEVLKLDSNSVTGKEWKPNKGEFRSLKFLKMHGSLQLKKWNADYTHFPVLEKLVLELLYLDGIPLGFAEIPTLRFIRVYQCSLSTSIPPVEILEETERFGNRELQVEVKFFNYNGGLLNKFKKMVDGMGFASNNLHVKTE